MRRSDDGLHGSSVSSGEGDKGSSGIVVGTRTTQNEANRQAEMVQKLGAEKALKLRAKFRCIGEGWKADG